MSKLKSTVTNITSNPTAAGRRLRRRIGFPDLTFFEPLFKSKLRKAAVAVVFFYIVMAFIGPDLAPHGPFETQRTEAGRVISLSSPSWEYPMGTTNFGFDVFSQTLRAFQISVFVGAGSATMIVFIGMNLGLISGYFGGKVDSLIMGMTDVIYGLPLLPFGIVFVAVLGQSDLNIVLVIGLLVWRTIARITRSETLTLREREFIKGARAAGSSHFTIIYKHILPNLIPLIVLYFVFGAIWGIMIEASLSFLGLGDPNTVSWGLMLYRVYSGGVFTEALWWVFFPALALFIFIMSLYIIARALEENVDATDAVAGE
ncbi:MAG: peptide/nickel transport system permease protein [Natronomonas sp.]|jgi:peptide/nickel transport system permease protein